MDKSPPCLQASVRKVLSELTARAVLALGDNRLEVRVVGAAHHYRVWAYFPIWPEWSRLARVLDGSGIRFDPKVAEEAMLETHAVRVCGKASLIREADMYERARIVRELLPRFETRVLLVFGAAGFEEEQAQDFRNYLRHHLGHVLLFLREPKGRNHCDAATTEWRMCSSRVS